VLCEVLTNVLWGLARMASGEPSITPALVERLWDEESGLFVDQVEPGGARPRVETWAALAPLALPDLPQPIGRRLVDEHLLDQGRFWLPVAPPSVSAAEPSFEPGRARGLVRRYWRGPTWVNAAWLVWMGMVRLGHVQEAERMATALGKAVESEGFREYFHPRTGAGLGATDFAWSSLVVEMADPDPAAARSHL
jgi:glycogen debranching enzyme